MTIGCSKEESKLNSKNEPHSSISKNKNSTEHNKSATIYTTYIAFVDSASWKIALTNFCDSFFVLHLGTIDISWDPSTQLNMLVTHNPAQEDEDDPSDDADLIVCRGELSNVKACANRYVRHNVFSCYANVEEHKCGCGVWEAHSAGDPPC